MREAINSVLSSVVQFARDLKISGSELVVEEDLAAIFGRGLVDPKLETHFKNLVTINSFTSLHNGSEIVLTAGPGPTVYRALKDKYYMAVVIQLSFLCWMHEKASLGAALGDCMLKRHRLGVIDATSNPDYDGLYGFVQACSAQTSQFCWEHYVREVELRLQSFGWIREHQENPFSSTPNILRHLSPNALLAAMDYLYLIQSLPEDRVMVVEHQMGVLPLIIWSHYILGLSVRVTASEKSERDIFFGNTDRSQVVINWVSERELVHRRNQIVFLMDSSLNVVLRSDPDMHDMTRIEAQERVRLGGYGMVFLHRSLNMDEHVLHTDPIYREYAELATARALVKSKLFRRRLFPFKVNQPPFYQTGCVERWRIHRAAEVFFEGIQLNATSIEEYVQRINGLKICEMPLPPRIRHWLESHDTKITAKLRSAMHSRLNILENGIIVWSRVVEVAACADMPIVYNPSILAVAVDIQNAREIEKPIDLESNGWLAIMVLLLGMNTADSASWDSRAFLISDHGWSVFLSNVGDEDPANVNCELVCVKRGTPTSTKTGERRYRILDAPSIRDDSSVNYILEHEGRYEPRSTWKVNSRVDNYSSRVKEFWHNIRLDLVRSIETISSKQERMSKYVSYSRLHRNLWRVMVSAPCSHLGRSEDEVRLDLGVVTAEGFWWGTNSEPARQGGEISSGTRICICLVKGDQRARWLVVAGLTDRGGGSGLQVIDGEMDDAHASSSEENSTDRKVMLRKEECCVECVVREASAIEGKWLIIL